MKRFLLINKKIFTQEPKKEMHKLESEAWEGEVMG